jgi:hypothetical protein
VYPRVWKEENKAFQADFDAKGNDQRTFDLSIPDDKRSSLLATTPAKVESEVPIKTEEEETMTAGTSRSDRVDPGRRLVYRFLSLPYHVQIRIAQELNLLRDNDTDISPNGICRLVCKRAREGALLEELWNAVESSHGAADTRDNPFIGM